MTEHSQCPINVVVSWHHKLAAHFIQFVPAHVLSVVCRVGVCAYAHTELTVSLCRLTEYITRVICKQSYNIKLKFRSQYIFKLIALRECIHTIHSAKFSSAPVMFEVTFPPTGFPVPNWPCGSSSLSLHHKLVNSVTAMSKTNPPKSPAGILIFVRSAYPIS